MVNESYVRLITNEKYHESHYWLKEEETDVLFIVEGRPVPALKDVLTIKSKVFAKKFRSMDPKTKDITLEDTDCEAFKTMIEWLYIETLDLKDENDVKEVSKVLKIAVKYKIYRLVEAINEVIKKMLNHRNFDYFCEMAFEVKDKQLIPIFREFMSNNFESFKTRKHKYLKNLDKLTDHSWLDVITTKTYNPSLALNQYNLSNDVKYPELYYLFNEKTCDVLFILKGDEDCEHKVPALRQVLALKSPVFRAMFSENWCKKSPKPEIMLKDTNYEAFKVMIRFLYTNQMSTDDQELVGLCADILQMADYYLIPPLIDQTVESMAKNMNRFPQLVPLLKNFMKTNFKYFYRKPTDELKRINEYTNQIWLEIICERFIEAEEHHKSIDHKSCKCGSLSCFKKIIGDI